MLLATNEHPAADTEPEVVRAAAEAAQPPPAAVRPHAEHVGIAARVGDGLHSDVEPPTSGLVGVRKAEFGTDLGRTERKSSLLCALVDVPSVGPVGEAEVSNGDRDELHFGLLVVGRRRETSKDVVAPVTDAEATLRESLPEVVGTRPSRSQRDCLPRGEDGRVGFHKNELVAHKAFHSVYATVLVEERFDADSFDVDVVLCHVFLLRLIVGICAPAY